MSDEAVRIEVTGRIDGKIARSLRDIARAAIDADTNLDLLRNAIRGFNAGSAIKAASQDTSRLRSEIRQATVAQRQLSTATNTAASSFQKAALQATRYGTSLQAANTQTKGLVAGTNNLRGLLGTLGGLFGGIFVVGKFIQAQDALTNVNNMIKTITTSSVEAAALQEKLFDLANRTRSDITATTAAYVNFNKNLSAIGASSAEVFRIVETLNKGFIVGGKSAAEAAGSTRQFIQGLQNGALRGEEFNSVMEAFPVEIIEQFAKTLGVNRTELRKLAEQGKITATVIRESLGGAAGVIDELFSRLTPTIAGAITVLNNKFIEFTANTTGAAATLANTILFIADNLNIIIPLIGAFGAAWAAVKVAGLIVEVASLAKTILTLAVAFTAANAITLLWASVIALVGTALLALAYSVAVITGQADAFEQAIADSILKVKDWATGLFGATDAATETTAATNKFVGATLEAESSLQAATNAIEGLTDATNDNGDAVSKWAKETKNHINSVASSYADLSSAAQAALRAGAQVQYAMLQATGGSSGSQVALGRPTGGSTITTLQKPPAFASGGSMRVSGRSGIDKNLVSFRATNGERIDVKTAAQQRAEDRARQGGNDNAPVSGPTYIFNIETPDADSFRLSRGQISSSVYGATG